MRWRSAAKLSIYLAAVVSTSASGSQIQTFKNAPARPATAAQQIAKEQQQQQSEARLDTPEARTEKALNEARGHFGALYALLKEMPKGGDLHNHLTGAVYAESLILFAADSGLCIDRQSLALAQPPCQPNQAEARQALSDPELYRNAIDAWSMRGIKLKPESNGHDHFFDSFSKFSPATEGHLAQMLAEVSQRAADGNVQYLELMVAPDHGRAAALGAKLSYDPDFAAMRHKLLDADFGSAVEEARKNLDAMERGRNEELRCASEPEVQAGACSVHARYIYPVARAAKASQVFAQMLMGFELASRDPRVVAVNLIQPEDGYVPMHDFRLHMQMVSFLKSVYPNVHITLHAGELAPGLVPPDGLRFHIRESIEVGKAERIGHGVDVMYEENPHELLADDGAAQHHGRDLPELERGDSRGAGTAAPAGDVLEGRSSSGAGDRRRGRFPLRDDARIRARRGGPGSRLRDAEKDGTDEPGALFSAWRQPVERCSQIHSGA